MTYSRLIAVFLTCASLAACGGNDPKPLDCDEGQQYENRNAGKRVVVPDGLDPLNEFAEMPIPKADPEAPEPAAGKCVDMPPSVR